MHTVFCGRRASRRAVARRLKYAGVAQLVERLPCKQRVAGSSPVASSRRTKQRQRVLERFVPARRFILELLKWGHSSVGRAVALQATGREFEPPWFHHKA